VITQDDLIAACKEQIISQLELHGFNRRVVPETGLDDLVLDKKVYKVIEQISAKHKASSVLTGEWGFKAQGMCVAISGLHGTGKSTLAQAIAYECGRPIKTMTCGELLTVTRQKAMQNADAVFSDLNTGAVVVIEGAESLFGGSPWTGNNSLISFILFQIRRFSTIFVFILQGEVHTGQVLALNPAQKALFREFDFVIGLQKPKHDTREKMWRKLIPDKVPISAKDPPKFEKLSGKFEKFVAGDIAKVIRIASSRACLREKDKRELTHADLLDVGVNYMHELETHGLIRGDMPLYS
jgi:SpoVK/Ycf46/Vps4 family AAA+-type ATPase